MFYPAHQLFFNAIAEPNRALELIAYGVPLVCLEFVRPGTVIPGVCGAVMMVLGLHSLALLSLSPAGVFLIAGGLCVLALEGRFSKRWICTGAGAVAMLAGLLRLVTTGSGVRPGIALAVTLVFALSSGFLLPVACLARKMKRAGGAGGALNDKQARSGYAMAGNQ